MTISALLHAKEAGAVPALPRANGREKFLSAKIPRNPLKMLDSDEIVRDLRNIKDLSGR
jgi:hypothetical protein